MNHIYLPDRTPYTYLVGWSRQNLWYYGLRFAKDCHPSEFWKSYFTSSKRMVKCCREFYGEPDVIEIRKIFKSIQSARNWESKVLKRMKVVKDPKWLNESDNKAMINEIPPMLGKKWDLKKTEHFRSIRKGKTWEELFGIEEAKIAKQKSSVAKTGVKKSETWKRNISKSHNKEWEIIYPSGEIEIIVGLQSFCNLNNLRSPKMMAVADGERTHHKGFSCKRLFEKRI